MSSSKYLPLRIVLCLQIILFAVVTNGHANIRQRFCGPKLTKTMQTYCRNNYASRPYNSNVKRSDDAEDNEYVNNEPLSHPQFAYRTHPLGNLVRQFDLTTALGTAVKRGVVDECCVRPCTLEELMYYCAE
ncbi:bombyxin C-1-like [Bradysia coprophila]|uniref:bombyxin C-1-like n=1 Tax=Bradysia coprophila TaxID=38358 RepID=UPI00187DCE2E|nr:bombyxin C-1-like [Bradysia coprophila]